MHFLEGRSQISIAELLGLHIRTIEDCIARAVRKRPELEALRHRKRPRPRVTTFSQIGRTRHEAFNIDAA